MLGKAIFEETRIYIEDTIDDIFEYEEDIQRQKRFETITLKEIKEIAKRITEYDILWEVIYELIEKEIEETLESRKEVKND